MDERETFETERDGAWQRAMELLDDHSHLDASTILAAVDDEYVGGVFSPSGNVEFVAAVEALVDTRPAKRGRPTH